MLKVKYKWVDRGGRLWLLEAEDGEVVDSIAGNYANDTWEVFSSSKSYTSLKAAQTVAVKDYFLRLQKAQDKQRDKSVKAAT